MYPWWVITLLSKGIPGSDEPGILNHDSIQSLIDHQLIHWSRGCGAMLDVASTRWWRVDPWPESSTHPVSPHHLAETVDGFIYNPTQRHDEEPAPRVVGDGNRLWIAVVGDATDPITRDFMPALGRMIRLRAEVKFPGINIHPVALLHVPQKSHEHSEKAEIARFLTDLNTMMRNASVAERPFESVVIIQDRCESPTNPRGYPDLSSQEVNELIVQVLFHLMITEGKVLGGEQLAQGSRYLAIGAGAIFFDWKSEKQHLATGLGEELITKFVSAEQSPFVQEREVSSATDSIANLLSPASLFKDLTLDEKRNSFTFDLRIWERPRDSRGKEIYAWSVFKRELLNVYFKFYIRYLPVRLAEYVRLYLLDTDRIFKEFLRVKSKKIWEGDGLQSGLKETIDETVRGVLMGEHGRARSIQQVKHVLARLKELFNLEELDSTLTNLDQLKSLEVFSIPGNLRSLYESADPELSKAGETKLSKNLREALERHPLPAALFLRAGVIAFMFAFFGERLLDVLSPRIVNLEWLLNVPGLAFILLFSIPLICALWKYQVMTLQPIRTRLQKYVAAVLRHAQERAKRSVVEQIKTLGTTWQAYCDELTTHFSKIAEELHFPEVSTDTYRTTAFHRSIRETIRIPFRADELEILSKSELQFPLPTEDGIASVSELSHLQKHALIARLLDCPTGIPEVSVAKNLLRNGLLGDPLELETAESAIREFVEGLFDRVSDTTLDRLLKRKVPDHVKDLGVRWQSLIYPPCSLHPAGVVNQVDEQWSYFDVEAVEALFRTNDVVPSTERCVLSRCLWQRIDHLNDIATVRAMEADRSLIAASQTSTEAPRVFAVAGTKLVDSTKAGTMFDAISGSTFVVEDTVLSSALELANALGLTMHNPDQEAHSGVREIGNDSAE